MSEALQYFFTYELDLPDSVEGFSYYGTYHMCWLIALVVLCVVLCPVYRRMSARGQKRMGIVLCTIPLVIEVLSDSVLLYNGCFEIQHLPLHLCGLTMFVSFYHALTQHDWAGQVLFCLGLPGALCALLFPDWNRCPPLHYETLHGFINHTLLVLYPVLQLAAGRIRPDVRRIWKPVLFLLCTALPLYFLNKVWGTNFMFLNWASAGSPLEPLEDLLGNPGYLIGFAGLLVLVWTALYLPPTVYQVRKRKKLRIAAADKEESQ